MCLRIIPTGAYRRRPQVRASIIGRICGRPRHYGRDRIPYPLPYRTEISTLSHTKREKLKLLNRVKRVRGQIEAVERALEEEKGCANILHLIVAARGALSSLMTEVIEDHIRLHVVDPARDSERNRGAEELIEAVQAYLK